MKPRSVLERGWTLKTFSGKEAIHRIPFPGNAQNRPIHLDKADPWCSGGGRERHWVERVFFVWWQCSKMDCGQGCPSSEYTENHWTVHFKCTWIVWYVNEILVKLPQPPRKPVLPVYYLSCHNYAWKSNIFRYIFPSAWINVIFLLCVSLQLFLFSAPTHGPNYGS